MGNNAAIFVGIPETSDLAFYFGSCKDCKLAGLAI
jgi:hypothetical protein